MMIMDRVSTKYTVVKSVLHSDLDQTCLNGIMIIFIHFGVCVTMFQYWTHLYTKVIFWLKKQKTMLILDFSSENYGAIKKNKTRFY